MRRAYRTSGRVCSPIGKTVAWLSQAFLTLKNRILADGGEIDSQSDLNSYIAMAKANGIYDSIQFGMLGAYNIRTSGNTKYVTKAYSMDDTPSDGTQTTESLQPYLSGFIAPNEKWGIKNPTEDSRLLSIPSITITGTITKVEATDITGKITITQTDVVSQNITSLIPDIFTGAYFVRNETLSAAQKAAEATKLRQIFPEIPSVNIGAQTWATSNCEMVATPQGNTIMEVRGSDYSELIKNGTFDDGADWFITGSDVNISGGTLNFANATANDQFAFAVLSDLGGEIGDWIKLSFTILNYSSGELKIRYPDQVTGITANGVYTYYLKIALNLSLRFTPNVNGTTLSVDNVSTVKMGWANRQELYEGLISQGSTERDALEAASGWCYHGNDSEIGAIYGKIYDGYAKDLLVSDITANGAWDYHVSTEVELTALALNGGYALKYGGTDYWNTANGTNTTGFTALGGGTRSDVNGAFSTIKDSTAFWCADSDKVLLLNHADNTATIVAADKSFGAYIRLVKD